MKPNSH